jgi:hypothetical protein
VLGEEPLEAVAAAGAFDVDDVEQHAGAQADVGVWPAPPPRLDLLGVGGGVVDAVAFPAALAPALLI